MEEIVDRHARPSPLLLEVLTGVDPRELPTLAALATHWAPARERDSYDTGLRALVDGLVARATPPGQLR